MNKPDYKIPLHRAWYAIVILASMLPALVIASWVYGQAHDILLEREMLKEEVFHKQVEVYLSSETERLLSVLQNKSDTVSHLVAQGFDQALAKKILARIVTRDPMFNTVTIYDLNANAIIGVEKGEHSQAVIHQKSPAFVIASHGRTFIGAPTRLKDKHFEFVISVPLLQEDMVVGVLLSTINIAEFWQSIQAKVHSHDLTNVYLVDGRGVKLTGEHGKVQAGELLSYLPIVRTLLADKDWNKTVVYQGVSGGSVYAIGSRIANLHWGIISEIPVSFIRKPIEKSLIVLVIIVFLVHFIFAIVGVLLIRRILKPISNLVEAMQGAESGNYAVALEPSSFQEINGLILGFSQLLTEIKQREKELVQSQKMESIGILVGGIAHDFNNILAAITGNIFLTKTYLREKNLAASMDKVESIEDLSQQAAKMVAHLLAYARKGVIQKETELLNTLTAETIDLTKIAVPEDVSFETYITDKPLWAYVDATQVQQMVLNLLNNARYAVKHTTAPVIRLTLHAFTPSANFLEQHPEAKEGAYACLSVEDNGCGIEDEDLQQIFDPFFTTKGVGEGSGLGLSMIYGMVQSHDGLITVHSILGKGSVFNVYLRLVDKPEHHKEETVDLNIVEAKGETILFVDDEASIRETYVEVLTSLGYRVLLAQNGEEGLALFEQNDDVALVVSDVVMPRMGGVELARRIRDIRGDIGFILMTGYDESSVLSNEKVANCKVFTKPIDFETLHQAIQNMLDIK